MTALVIGASGFLGSHVTRVLAERGDEVRALIRPTRAPADPGTMGTLPIGLGRPAREDDGPHDWLPVGGDYIRSRVAAEAARFFTGEAARRRTPTIRTAVLRREGRER